MSDNKIVEDKPKTEQQRANEFLKDYGELCEKYQFQIVVTPAWRASQDMGDWRLVLQSSIGELPKKV